MVTSEAAGEAYAGIWNLPVSVGSIGVRRARTATGTEEISAAIATDTPLATLHLPDAYAVEPGMIRCDPLLSVRAREGDAEVIQFSGAPVVQEAKLAKGAAITCTTDAWTDPWFRLRSLNMISATFATADMELTDPVVQQARPGAGDGRRPLIASGEYHEPTLRRRRRFLYTCAASHDRPTSQYVSGKKPAALMRNHPTPWILL